MRWDGRLWDRWVRLHSAGNPITFIPLASRFSVHVVCSNLSTGGGQKPWDRYITRVYLYTHTHPCTCTLPEVHLTPELSSSAHTCIWQFSLFITLVSSNVSIAVRKVISTSSPPEDVEIRRRDFFYVIFWPLMWKGAQKKAVIRTLNDFAYTSFHKGWLDLELRIRFAKILVKKSWSDVEKNNYSQSDPTAEPCHLGMMEEKRR